MNNGMVINVHKKMLYKNKLFEARFIDKGKFIIFNIMFPRLWDYLGCGEVSNLLDFILDLASLSHMKAIFQLILLSSALNIHVNFQCGM